MMFPYTVLARRQVEDARSAGDDNTIALLVRQCADDEP